MCSSYLFIFTKGNHCSCSSSSMHSAITWFLMYHVNFRKMAKRTTRDACHLLNRHSIWWYSFIMNNLLDCAMYERQKQILKAKSFDYLFAILVYESLWFHLTDICLRTWTNLTIHVSKSKSKINNKNNKNNKKISF